MTRFYRVIVTLKLLDYG
ncbi:rCG25896 [Rattus norvegicus]|uniref:RCG25896 n=1 Tax=Rattus norvegicus TaxID=10116 RepID=A6I1Z9_RAT|nr:rCG25896 [Rattus norvegicus]